MREVPLKWSPLKRLDLKSAKITMSRVSKTSRLSQCSQHSKTSLCRCFLALSSTEGSPTLYKRPRLNTLCSGTVQSDVLRDYQAISTLKSGPWTDFKPWMTRHSKSVSLLASVKCQMTWVWCSTNRTLTLSKLRKSLLMLQPSRPSFLLLPSMTTNRNEMPSIRLWRKCKSISQRFRRQNLLWKKL